MVHGIRPDVPDSLICVKKSFLMNTNYLLQPVQDVSVCASQVVLLLYFGI